MKLKKFFGIFLFICSVFLISCSEDDDFKNIDLTDAPYYVTAFLDNIFPGNTPEKIIKLKSPDAETGTQFTVTYANGISVDFDKEGVWQQVLSTNGISLDEASKTLIWEGIKESIRELYHDQPIIGVKKIQYGECYTLENNQQLYFIGSSLMGSVLPVTEHEQLPGKIQQFVSEHFPQAEYELVAKASPTDDYEPLYHLWLQDSFHLAFNEDGDWVIIEKDNEQLIPGTVILSLPDELQADLQKHYPDAQISRLSRYGENAYLVRVSSNNTYDYNPDRYNIVWPNEQIDAFLDKYFGKFSQLSYRTSTITKEKVFDVIMPNGFNLSVDKKGDWIIVDGHGFPFPEALYEIVPATAHRYLKETYPEAMITKIDRTISYGYLIALTDGGKYKFDNYGSFIEEDTEETAPNQKVINYIRYNYPEDIDYMFMSWDKDGYTYAIKGNKVLLKFDLEGNPIE